MVEVVANGPKKYRLYVCVNRLLSL